MRAVSGASHNIQIIRLLQPSKDVNTNQRGDKGSVLNKLGYKLWLHTPS